MTGYLEKKGERTNLDLAKLKWISDEEGVWLMEGFDDQHLKKYYVETAEYQAIKNQPRKCIVCGRKGAGKSAIKRLLSEPKEGRLSLDLDFEAVYSDDFFAKYQSKCKIDGHVSVDVIRYVFLINLFKSIIQSGKYTEEELYEDGAVEFLEKRGLLLVDLESLVNGKKHDSEIDVEFKIPFATVGGKFELDIERQPIDWFEVPSSALLNDLEEFIIGKIKKFGCQTLILTDRIDAMRDEWERAYSTIIPNLVKFVISFNKKVQEQLRNGTKIILFIRTDLWNIYCRGKTDFNKYEQDLMVRVNWPDLDILDNPLFSVIEKRLEYLVSRAEELSKKKTYYSKPLLENVIQNSHVFRERNLKSFLNKTQLKPRDMIALFKCAIETDDYNEFYMQYSSYLYSEIKEEIKVPLENQGGVELVSDVLRDIFELGKNEFCATEFITKYCNATVLHDQSKDSHNDAMKVLEILFEYSVIGWKSGDITKFKYRDTTGGLNFIRKDKYRLHDGLLKYFGVV